VRDGPAAAQVAEAEAVMAVDQDARVVESVHTSLPGLLPRDRGRLA
jgi:hypothetical protein